MPPRPEEYYLLLNGETSGPYSLAELHRMWLEDKITLDTLFVRPGMKKCQPINLILGMVINFQAPSPGELAAAAEATAAREEEENPWAPLKNVLRWAGMACIMGVFIWVIGPWRYAGERQQGAMRAVVEIKPADLRVSNESEFEWKDMVVHVNGQPPAGYKRKLSSLPSGAAVDITLLEFTDASGAPFEPWRMSVSEVWIGNDKIGYRSFRVRLPRH